MVILNRIVKPYYGGVTTPREALLEKLVVSLHLNMPERQMLGSDAVSVEEVAAVVKRLLDKNGVFPPNAKPGFANGLCQPRTTSYGLGPVGPAIIACGDCASSAAPIVTATTTIVISGLVASLT